MTTLPKDKDGKTALDVANDGGHTNSEFVARSAGKPSSWLGDLWAFGKKLIVGSSDSKPASLDPSEASLSTRPAVCSDPPITGELPIRPTTGPKVLEMGDQWVKNSDSNVIAIKVGKYTVIVGC
jgi:hypothetical protein